MVDNKFRMRLSPFPGASNTYSSFYSPHCPNRRSPFRCVRIYFPIVSVFFCCPLLNYKFFFLNFKLTSFLFTFNIFFHRCWFLNRYELHSRNRQFSGEVQLLSQITIRVLYNRVGESRSLRTLSSSLWCLHTWKQRIVKRS